MTIKEETVQMPRLKRAASVEATSFDAEENTIDVIWTTGADVQRSDYSGDYIERLATGPENVRLGRLNAGAPLLDSHQSFELSSVIGSVVPGSARMNGGQGFATVKLSSADRAADSVRDIRDGIIRNISVGYHVHKFERTEGRDGSIPIMTATDWEPVEISAVPVPADAGAQFRGAFGVELNNCTIVTTRNCEETTLADTAKDITDDEDLRSKARDDDDSDDSSDDGEMADDADEKRSLDVKRIAAEAISAERKRINTIHALARDYGLDALGATHADAGTSVRRFKDVVLESLKERTNAHPISTATAAPTANKLGAKDERSAGAAWAKAFNERNKK